MKKIKIITFNNELNYGAVLQAYALQKAIKNEGGEPYFGDISLKNFNQLTHKSLKEIIIQTYVYIINQKKEMQFKQFKKRSLKPQKMAKKTVT